MPYVVVVTPFPVGFTVLARSAGACTTPAFTGPTPPPPRWRTYLPHALLDGLTPFCRCAAHGKTLRYYLRIRDITACRYCGCVAHSTAGWFTAGSRPPANTFRAVPYHHATTPLDLNTPCRRVAAHSGVTRPPQPTHVTGWFPSAARLGLRFYRVTSWTRPLRGLACPRARACSHTAHCSGRFWFCSSSLAFTYPHSPRCHAPHCTRHCCSLVRVPLPSHLPILDATVVACNIHCQRLFAYSSPTTYGTGWFTALAV